MKKKLMPQMKTHTHTHTHTHTRLFQSVSPPSAHPLIPLCWVHSSFLFLTKGHNTSIIPPEFHLLLRSPFLYICLPVPSVSLWFPPHFLHLLFSPTPSLLFPFVLLPWQLYHTFPCNAIFFLFWEKKSPHLSTAHTGRCWCTPPLSLSLSPPIYTLSATVALRGNELLIFMMKPSPNYSLYLFPPLSMSHLPGA